MAVTSNRNLTAAPWPGTWSSLGAPAVLVEPDRRHGTAIIAGVPGPAGCRSADEHPGTHLILRAFRRCAYCQPFLDSEWRTRLASRHIPHWPLDCGRLRCAPARVHDGTF